MTPTRREQVALHLIARNLGIQLNTAIKTARREPELKHVMSWSVRETLIAARGYFHAVKFAAPHRLRELAVAMHGEMES